MAVPDQTLRMIDDLRERGVTRATFHPDGSLASVDYGPTASGDEPGDPQHAAPTTPTKRQRSVGGLVPRAVVSST